MTNPTLEKLTWRLIFGGIFLLMLGLWLPADAARLGNVLAAVGAVTVLVGAVLVWVRARRPDDAAPPPGAPR